MKVIKFLLMALFGLVVIWAGLVLLGFVGTIMHILFWLAILYIVGMIVWKLIGGGGSKDLPKPQLDAKRQMESLKEASAKLEEMKREQRLKQKS